MSIMESFNIDFTYEGVAFIGLVTADPESGQDYYIVKIESENQESYADIIAIPPDKDGLWIFKCADKTGPPESYDKSLLSEIGEAIEKHETSD
jgi:hypothetical protein